MSWASTMAEEIARITANRARVAALAESWDSVLQSAAQGFVGQCRDGGKFRPGSAASWDYAMRAANV